MRRSSFHRFNKRASLEISIQAIVIVVLAMTLLGLGLGFVRNLFDDIGGTTSTVTESVKQKITDDLLTSDKKVSFPKSEITLASGKSELLSIGVRNKDAATMSYTISFRIVSVSPPVQGDLTAIATQWFQFDPSITQLPPTEIAVKNVRLEIPKTASKGSYNVVMTVSEQQSGAPVAPIYDQKDFFIIVR